MRKIQSRRVHSAEFKRDAVKLALEGDRRVSEVAEGLGIAEGNLYRWIKKYKDDPRDSFPGHGKLKPADEQLRQLTKELKDITEERDILKKAISIFSKTQQ